MKKKKSENNGGTFFPNASRVGTISKENGDFFMFEFADVPDAGIDEESNIIPMVKIALTSEGVKMLLMQMLQAGFSHSDDFWNEFMPSPEEGTGADYE